MSDVSRFVAHFRVLIEKKQAELAVQAIQTRREHADYAEKTGVHKGLKLAADLAVELLQAGDPEEVLGEDHDHHGGEEGDGGG